MNTPQTETSGPSLADEFEAALAWWKAAGVDYDYTDDVTDWLAEADGIAAPSGERPPPSAKRAAPPPPPPPKKIGGPREDWPATLEEFQEWWLSSTEVDDGGTWPVIAPRGKAGTPLMVLVTEPEESDTGSLLDGPQGRLLLGMLRAAGIDPAQCYICSALRRHTPLPDWDALAASGLGELTLHHIALVGPERILTFGRNILPLLGNDTAQGAAILHNLNHEGRSIPVMGVGSLAELVRSAPRRKRFWHHWLQWTE